MVKTVPSNAGAAGSTPDGGTKIPHASLLKNQSQDAVWASAAVISTISLRGGTGRGPSVWNAQNIQCLLWNMYLINGRC